MIKFFKELFLASRLIKKLSTGSKIVDKYIFSDNEFLL